MKTTEIVVELVVVGSGIFFLMLMHVFSTGLQSELNWLLGSVAFFGFVSFIVCYVSGIIIDRVADFVFSPLEDLVRRQYFSSIDSYQKFRVEIHDSSLRARDWSQYSRIRARVCRGWIVNIFIIGTYISISDAVLHFPIWFVIVFGAMLFFSWWRLTLKEISSLAMLKKIR